jgi:hypothetical protein
MSSTVIAKYCIFVQNNIYNESRLAIALKSKHIFYEAYKSYTSDKKYNEYLATFNNIIKLMFDLVHLCIDTPYEKAVINMIESIKSVEDDNLEEAIHELSDIIKNNRPVKSLHFGKANVNGSDITIGTDEVPINFETLCPNTTNVLFSSHSNFTQDNLTYLPFSVTEIECTSYSGKLPVHITKATIHRSDDFVPHDYLEYFKTNKLHEKFVDNFPKNLLHIHVEKLSKEMLARLPRNMISINGSVDWTPELLAEFKDLTEISIGFGAAYGPLMCIFNNLPCDLITLNLNDKLDIGAYNKTLVKSLPKSLRVIKLRGSNIITLDGTETDIDSILVDNLCHNYKEQYKRERHELERYDGYDSPDYTYDYYSDRYW